MPRGARDSRRTLRVPGDWQKLALCRRMDPDLFFPSPGDSSSSRVAKEVCESCPVQLQCLLYALEVNENFGIWGGRSEKERRYIRNRQRTHPHISPLAPVTPQRKANLCRCGCGETVSTTYQYGTALFRPGHNRRVSH